MRLYSIQTIGVLAELQQYQMYKPKWELCEFIIYCADIAKGYIWLVDQYNSRKNNEYLGPLVWWYTDFKEAIRDYKRMMLLGRTDIVLINANVDDKDILLQDADLWEDGPLCGFHLGFRASSPWLDNHTWTDKDERTWEAVTKAYKRNHRAAEETWKESLIITKNTKRIHAVTPFIYMGWLEKHKEISTDDRLQMEM